MADDWLSAYPVVGAAPGISDNYNLAPDFGPNVDKWAAAVKERTGLEPVITEGYRDPKRSDTLRAQGVMALPGGQSYHNYGEAFDYGFKGPKGTDLHNEKAYAEAEKIAHEFGITGISNESGHLQNSNFSVRGAKSYDPYSWLAQYPVAGSDTDVKRTEYGPQIDASRIGYNHPDSHVGDRGNPLGSGDVALTQAERQAKFGVTGKSTGKTFSDQGRTVTDADTAPESDKRIDYYRPGASQSWLADYPVVDQTKAPRAVPVAQPVSTDVQPAQSVESGYATPSKAPVEPVAQPAANPWDLGKFFNNLWQSGVQSGATAEAGGYREQLNQKTPPAVLPYEAQVQKAKEDQILADPNTSREEADSIISARNQKSAQQKADLQKGLTGAETTATKAEAAIDQPYAQTGPGKVAGSLGGAVPYVASGALGPVAPIAFGLQNKESAYEDIYQRAKAKGATDDTAHTAAEEGSAYAGENGLVLSLLPVPGVGPLVARLVERMGMRGAYLATSNVIQRVQANQAIQKNVDPKQAITDGLQDALVQGAVGGAAFELPHVAGEVGKAVVKPPETAQEPSAPPPAIEAPKTPENVPTWQSETPKAAVVEQKGEVPPQSLPAESTTRAITGPIHTAAEEHSASEPIEETEPWVSRIANRFTEERSAQGEIGEIAPGQGYATEDLIKVGQRMKPEEIAQHVSDLMQNTGDPKLQAGAVRAEEARLSDVSSQASRVAEANPADRQAQVDAENAFKDLTDFHNGPVAKLKNNWHAQGMTLQGEIPVDLGTFNGLREAWLRDVGKPPTPDQLGTMKRTAKQVRDAATAEKIAMDNLSQSIDRANARPIPSAEEVRNRIMERFKDDPCIVR
jgi:hypothetical protein